MESSLLSKMGGQFYCAFIVCIPHFLQGGRGLNLQPNFQKGRLDRISIFRGELLGKRGWTFSGGCSFYIKNKLKSKIFNENKIMKENAFSLIIKNLNWNTCHRRQQQKNMNFVEIGVERDKCINKQAANTLMIILWRKLKLSRHIKLNPSKYHSLLSKMLLYLSASFSVYISLCFLGLS